MALSNSMPLKIKKKILLDANAIIDLHKYSLWKQVIHACSAAITPIIKREVRFYIDGQGRKQQIDLHMDIQAKKIEEIVVSIEEFSSLEAILNNFFLQSIDAGEREVIAFLYHSQRKDEFLFCTADMLAIKCLGVLGLRYQGLSLQELFTKLHISINHLPSRYIQAHSKEVFERMLIEGFQEAHLHKKNSAVLHSS
jgi:hypothetical protein